MVKNDPSPVSDAAAEQLRRMLDVEPPPRRIAPVLITLIVLVLAVPLFWTMWHVYMQGTWTRDGTVRVDVDRLAPIRSSPGCGWAHRVPVRIRLDDVPPGVQLVAGMTATVEVGPPARG